jgi:vacuolar-type H+-ATPase subunit C/Vma6
MEVTLTIPDDVAAEIQNGGNGSLARRLLELAAIRAYEDDLLTTRQIQEMLAFEDREELFAFFKVHDVRDRHFTMDELEKGRTTLDSLFEKQ